MSLIWDRSTGKPERKLRDEFLAHENVSMGGEKVPIAEHDEGLRYLGYWIDACSDWGNQVVQLQERLGGSGRRLNRRG